jgi:phosphoribosylglycinamide formyltransferase 2
MSEKDLQEAQIMADKVTKALDGAGLWGVEFFIAKDGVYFSELSPRPHDTGMVTLAGTQNLNEFELHARAILGWPIPAITLERAGANAVIQSTTADKGRPSYTGIENVCKVQGADVRIFGKPVCRVGRRMGIVLTNDVLESNVEGLRTKASTLATKINVSVETEN